MHYRPIAALMGLMALTATTASAAQPIVDVNVQWLPDPAKASDWEQPRAITPKLEALNATNAKTAHAEVATFFELLDRAAQDAVSTVLEDVDIDARPVDVARQVADEIPFALESLCQEGDAWDLACGEIDRFGFTSVGVKVPSATASSERGYQITFGVRPNLKSCLIEMGCGDDD